MTPGRAIAVGGLVVGVLDFCYASWRTASLGRNWYGAWQGVASALLGQDAFTMGASAIALGIVCHFIVAYSVVAAYVTVSRFVPLLTRFWIPLGLLYGVFVFLVMNWVVIPLTRIGKPPQFSQTGLLLSLGVHLFVIGLPAAWFARRAAS